MIPRCLVCRLTLAFLAALLPLVAQEARLANLSTRAQAGTGANVLTAGFVVRDGPKQVLVRAVGPTLGTAFGLTGTLADPVLTVYGPNSSTSIAATNDDWGTGTQASAFTSVGAFALPAGSRDAALVATLQPGTYSAVVNGKNSTTGLALVEVYEVGGGTAKLINISTRAQVGTGANVVIPGIVISGTGQRRLLIRAAGPALAGFGLAGTLANPTLTLTTAAGTPIATNDNWGTPTGPSLADGPTLSAAFTAAGAFAFAGNSADAALLMDLGAGNYGIQVSGVNNTSGIALVEVYDVTPAASAEVSILATDPSADESGSNPGEFTLTRVGDTSQPLQVRYGVGGSAINGADYPPLVGLVTFPAGAATVRIPLVPNPDVSTDGTDTVTITITPGPGYIVAAANTATVSITDSPATLFIATIRPENGATSSTASGTATILLSQSGTLASVNVSYTGLSSATVSAHLRIGPSGDYVFNLPAGQVTGAQWTFTPSGVHSAADLLAALRSGNIYVGIDTARYPSGEVRGTFVQGTGSRTFTAPPAAPSVSLTGVTATDAARFLTQATFGPKKSEIDALTGGSISAWLDAQLAMSFTSHRTAVQSDKATFGGSPSSTNFNATYPDNRQAAWFKNALTAPDQLRQRMAFALSQILVVSEVSLGGDEMMEPLAYYYDILGNGAFGNFRTLLENVTLSPEMGLYLSSLRNSKADPVTGQTPDENYAREVMQLFTIGLVQLQPDGTLVLGANGLPIDTYNQTTITEMAKVFTGWSYPSTNLTTGFRTAPRNFYAPMQAYATNHDTTAKVIAPVGATIPAGGDGATDLRIALDTLYTHANTAPFISKALIKRFVTSNPSPAYVYRVAQVFERERNNPSQLGLVLRAILTDHEARSLDVAANQTFGKLKEPLLRLTQLLRAFNVSSPSGRYLGYQVTVNGTPITGTTPLPADVRTISSISAGTSLRGVQGGLAQAALRSPTVFNFYHPDYVLPGPLAAAGLVAPEFEITDDNYAISVPNSLRTFTLATVPTNNTAPYQLTLDLAYEQTLLGNTSALVDHLNLVLCANTMPAATKTRITTALAALPTATSNLERAQTAVLLTLTAPASAVQR